MDRDDPRQAVAPGQLGGEGVVDGHDRLGLAGPGPLEAGEPAPGPGGPADVRARVEEQLVAVVDDPPAAVPAAGGEGRRQAAQVVAVEDVGRAGAAAAARAQPRIANRQRTSQVRVSSADRPPRTRSTSRARRRAGRPRIRHGRRQPSGIGTRTIVKPSRRSGWPPAPSARGRATTVTSWPAAASDPGLAEDARVVGDVGVHEHRDPHDGPRPPGRRRSRRRRRPAGGPGSRPARGRPRAPARAGRAGRARPTRGRPVEPDDDHPAARIGDRLDPLRRRAEDEARDAEPGRLALDPARVGQHRGGVELEGSVVA